MQHISYTRQVNTRRKDDLGRLMPLDGPVGNFAAFCGTAQQRYSVAAQAIARINGRCGVIILHDDPSFDNYLYNSPLLANLRQNFSFINRPVYDPLYGMDAESIQNLIIPSQPGSVAAPEVERMRAGLLVYLEIMRLQFNKNQTPFGNYPYNLNLLLQLTQMPYETLDQQVLRTLPTALAQPMKDVINASGIQQSIYASVLNFSSLMRRYLWTPGDFQAHTGLSLIQCATNRQLISIRVPNSREEMLEYLNTELDILSQRNIPFLLISDSVKLSNCESLQGRFLNDHLQHNYFTGVMGAGFESVSASVDDASRLLSQHHEVFVFNCTSAQQILPFASQLGRYNRREVEYSTQRDRRPFHIFSSHQKGRSERYIEEYNIRPEDMMGYAPRALLCGINYKTPLIINNLDTNGGANNGLLLP